MDLQLYTDVVLVRDVPEESLCAGDVGTVVERHDVPGLETSTILSMTERYALRLTKSAEKELYDLQLKQFKQVLKKYFLFKVIFNRLENQGNQDQTSSCM